MSNESEPVPAATRLADGRWGAFDTMPIAGTWRVGRARGR